MKKLIVLIMTALLIASFGIFAQEKNQKSKQKNTITSQTTKQASKSGQTDKLVAGKKGPNGEKVYQGAQGGQYYINKSGNKSYLEDVDKVIEGKKGPNGEVVYEGPQGGQYYINKSGNKTYLENVDKVMQGKKGPNGEVVYEGPQGGQYYLNKNGEKVYLSKDKK